MYYLFYTHENVNSLRTENVFCLVIVIVFPRMVLAHSKCSEVTGGRWMVSGYSRTVSKAWVLVTFHLLLLGPVEAAAACVLAVHCPIVVLLAATSFPLF